MAREMPQVWRTRAISHSNVSRQDDAHPQIPKREINPTPSATSETTSTHDMPTTTWNVDSNKRISPKVTPPIISMAKFFKHLETTAKIRTTSKTIYVTRNHSITVPFQLRTMTKRVDRTARALLDSGATECFVIVNPRAFDRLKLRTRKLPKPRNVRNVDGTIML